MLDGTDTGPWQGQKNTPKTRGTIEITSGVAPRLHETKAQVARERGGKEASPLIEQFGGWNGTPQPGSRRGRTADFFGVGGPLSLTPRFSEVGVAREPAPQPLQRFTVAGKPLKRFRCRDHRPHPTQVGC